METTKKLFTQQRHENKQTILKYKMNGKHFLLVKIKFRLFYLSYCI